MNLRGKGLRLFAILLYPPPSYFTLDRKPKYKLINSLNELLKNLKKAILSQISMNKCRVPECLNLASPHTEAREVRVCPPAKRGSRVLEHPIGAWTSTEGEQSNVLEHGANAWHATPGDGVQTVLEHSHDELKSLGVNEIALWGSMPAYPVHPWHATSEDALGSVSNEDAGALEHAAARWHATCQDRVITQCMCLPEKAFSR